MIGTILIIMVVIVFFVIPLIVIFEELLENYKEKKLINSAKKLLNLYNTSKDYIEYSHIPGFCYLNLLLYARGIISLNQKKKYRKCIKTISHYLGLTMGEYWCEGYNWESRVKILNDIIYGL